MTLNFEQVENTETLESGWGWAGIAVGLGIAAVAAD